MAHYYRSLARTSEVWHQRIVWLALLVGVLVCGAMVWVYVDLRHKERAARKLAQQQIEYQQAIAEYNRQLRVRQAQQEKWEAELQKAREWVAKGETKSSGMPPRTIEGYFSEQQQWQNFQRWLVLHAEEEKRKARESPPMTEYEYERRRTAEEAERAYQQKLRGPYWGR